MGDEEQVPKPASRRNRVDPRLIERMAGATTEELYRALGGDDDDEKRQAAIELGRRGETDAFEPLVALLNNPDIDVANGAALGLAALGDPRAVRPLLDAVAERWRRDLPSAALVFAVTELDSLRALPELVECVRRGNYLVTMHGAEGIRDVWDEIAPAEQRAIRDRLLERLDDPDIEDWRADWIDDIATVGAWTPEERAVRFE